MSSRTLITDASTDPVTLAEMVAEIPGYVQSTANDTIVTNNIAAATRWLQEYTSRQFIQATHLQAFNEWRYEYIVHIQPLSSVTSVKYYDLDGVQQTVSSTQYYVDVYNIPPRIVFKRNYPWPIPELWRPNPIEIRYVSGYANAAAVPTIVKQCIKLLARYWWEKREAADVPNSQAPNAQTPTYGEIPFGVFSIANMINAGGYT